MRQFMASMCSTEIAENITNWLQHICKLHHIEVKDFVEINRFLTLHSPPCSTNIHANENNFPL